MIDWTTVTVTVAASFGAGLFSAGALYSAIRIDLKYQRRDIDRAHKRIDDHDKFHHQRG